MLKYLAAAAFALALSIPAQACGGAAGRAAFHPLKRLAAKRSSVAFVMPALVPAPQFQQAPQPMPEFKPTAPALPTAPKPATKTTTTTTTVTTQSVPVYAPPVMVIQGSPRGSIFRASTVTRTRQSGTVAGFFGAAVRGVGSSCPSGNCPLNR